MSEEGTQVPNNVPVEDLRAQLEELLEENGKRHEKLAKELEAAINPLDVANVRLSCLMSMLLDEHGRLRVEIATQTMLSNMLDTVLNEAAKQKAAHTLLQGVPGVDPNATPQGNPNDLLRNWKSG